MSVLPRCPSCRGVRLERVECMRKRHTLSTPINSFSRKFDLANTNKRSSFIMVENIQSTLSQVTDTSTRRTPQ